MKIILIIIQRIIFNFLTIIEMILMPILIKIQNLLKIFSNGGEIAPKDFQNQYRWFEIYQQCNRRRQLRKASLVQQGFNLENIGIHQQISVLFRDWINAERRNLGREPLPTKFQDDVDEVMQDYSDDRIEAMEDLSIQPIPEHVTKEMLNDLRRFKYIFFLITVRPGYRSGPVYYRFSFGPGRNTK